jgi:hypothetical protein
LNFELIPIGPLRPINALLEAAQKTAGLITDQLSFRARN